MCSAWRFCLSVYLRLSPCGMRASHPLWVASQVPLWGQTPVRPHPLPAQGSDTPPTPPLFGVGCATMKKLGLICLGLASATAPALAQTPRTHDLTLTPEHVHW